MPPQVVVVRTLGRFISAEQRALTRSLLSSTTLSSRPDLLHLSHRSLLYLFENFDPLWVVGGINQVKMSPIYFGMKYDSRKHVLVSSLTAQTPDVFGNGGILQGKT
jgi:hypothetical protein